jgi:hypothetical protein
MLFQRTLAQAIRATGVGLHSGNKVELTLRPAPADHGIVFRRVDLDSVTTHARQVGAGALFLSWLALITSTFIGSFRWGMMMRAYGGTAVPSLGSVIGERPQGAAPEAAFTVSALSRSWSKKPRHSAETLDGSAAHRSCRSSMKAALEP